ncbi:hypothetical protein KFL_001420140 [Klebsormidium nitens]|uniref:Uncharacterized protein n=1 Tax=Klebsormidium nitens TaxID=105231 RepID=A0A1Y1I1H2_KLENI|nr:hypothetical protein KFL_001420140 [Klebsormidium nitens]|eukprot:GAQ83289.1 hypothetical protein KFL_001420140 [Klebsormidium nitens]
MAGLPLTDLCLEHIASHLPAFAPDLPTLPLDLAERLFKHVVSSHPRLRPQPPSGKDRYAVLSGGPPSTLLNLHILADLFWQPWEIKLGFSNNLSKYSLLPLFSESLVRLDLSASGRLEDLSFLSSLQKLQCLNLSRSLVKLDNQQVSHIASIPSLRCLSLQYAQFTAEPQLQKETVEQLLAGLPSLRALDISGIPSVDDSTINILTYGHQYARWQASVQQAYEWRAARRRPLFGHTLDAADSLDVWSDGLGLQYPLTALVYLRVAECEGVTDKVVEYLSALPEIAFLDLRSTPHCRGSSLITLKARHGLTSMPNNSKLLFRSNATVKAALNGCCGCRALASGGVHILENEPRGVSDALSFEHPVRDSKGQRRWEEEGLSLLFEA